MYFLKYIFRGLVFYRKKHFAVLLATVLSTAIITGALIIGDSVKLSLQKIVDQRLGTVGFAFQSSNQMVTQKLANAMQTELNANVAGVIETNGVAINPDKQLRINQIKIYGVDSAFWNFSKAPINSLKNNEIYISENLSQRLSIDTGDVILVRAHVPQTIALNTPFSQDENTTTAIRLKVKQVLTDSEFGRFSLRSDQKSPFNIFVSYKFLGHSFNMNNKVNQVFVENKPDLTTHNLDKGISKLWQLADMGFKLQTENENLLRLSSDQIFINDALANVVEASGYKSQAVFTYLVNQILSKKGSTPYSFVTGLTSHSTMQLDSNQVIVNQWLANDQNLKVGDSITLKYYAFGVFRNLIEKENTFIVDQIESNNGNWFNKALMPDFPGLSDAGSCSEWEAGINIDLDKIRQKDEDYWDEYKGTPKAIISFNKAKQIWENNYGSRTGFFIHANESEKEAFKNTIKHKIKPAMLGLNFIDVNSRGEQAANNGVDFGELFLSLSFFVIVAALLLLILIYSINQVSRKNEIATLSAIGFKKRQILKVVLAESAITVVLGTVLGALLGIVYNNLLLKGLNTIWNNAVYTSALEVFVKADSVLVGIISGFVIAFASLFFLVKKLLKQSAASAFSESDLVKTESIKISRTIAFVLSVVALSILVYGFVSSQFSPTMALLLGGLLLLTLLFWFKVVLLAVLKRNLQAISTTALALKSMARLKSKSVVTVSMLAIGVFGMLVTGANRKTFQGSENKNGSGTGGFTFWAETSLPVLHDLNTPTGKDYIGIQDEPIFDSVTFVPMHKLNGDDASCLNLNQVRQPSVLGVDAELLNKQKAFGFAKLLPQVNVDAPWMFLKHNLGNNIYSVYLDQTVITWGLMMKVGDTLLVQSEQGDSVSFVIAGGLNSSVFQGNMLIDRDVFKKLFPSHGGANTFLIDVVAENKDTFIELFSYYLSDYGLGLQPTGQRLAQFNSVTNTYLNVFMLLGSLALLIGTFGLGLVVVRNLISRRKELAVLQAVGVKQSAILLMVLKEYIGVLIVGLVIGIISAVAGMIPSFLSEAFEVPWLFLGIMLIAIIINSLVWITIPGILILKKQTIEALQQE